MKKKRAAQGAIDVYLCRGTREQVAWGSWGQSQLAQLLKNHPLSFAFPAPGQVVWEELRTAMGKN